MSATPANESTEIEKLRKAIALLESQRETLGENITRMALAPLHEKLALLSAHTEYQRRMITVLFADVQNFTAMSEKLDMEVVSDTMAAVWKGVDQIITARGGVIDKHMGDSVMAVWGRKAIHEDDSAKAVHAALEIQACLKEMIPQDSRMPIVMRIGVHTGLAIVDASVDLDANVIGDTVNLALWLEKNAPPGRISISHETYRLVRGLFTVEIQPPLKIRGQSDPVQTYLVKEAKPLAFYLGTRGVEGVETPLVGRLAEMKLLQDAFRAIQASPHIFQATIVSEAGLGKSRLIHEFLGWAELQPADIWLFQGRASAPMMESPYSFLRDVFSLRFQIQDNDSPADLHAKFEQGLGEFMNGERSGEARFLEKAHYIGHLIGLDYSANPEIQAALKDPLQFQRQAIFYLAQFFSAVARTGLTFWVFDDMHWVDGASLSALQSILEKLPPDIPLLVLGSTRPTLFERHDWPVGDRLDLRPLSKQESYELVKQILKNIPNPVAILQDLVVSRAEGNPFYLEELIKMLIDTKVILIEGEQWRVETERLVNVHIPSTLVEVLQARLDDLRPDELLSLQRSAVVGRIFWDDAVAFMTDQQDPDRLRSILAALEQKEFIFQSQPSAFLGRREYRFKHAILHEVTYDTLLKSQRKEAHARVAEWLAQAAGEHNAQYIPQIAEHYEKASQTEKAAVTLFKAARRSAELAAYAEAGGFLEHSLALTNSLPASQAQGKLSAEIHIQWSSVLSHTGDYPEAQAHAETALALARQYDLSVLASDALASLGFMFTDQGEYDRAETYLAEALPLAQAGSDIKIQCFVLSSLAYVNARRANWPEAERYYRATRDLALQINDTERYLVALNGLGIVVRFLGQHETARQYWDEVVATGLAAGYRFALMSALNNLGSLCDEHGDFAGAIRYYEQAIEIASESGSRQREALLAANMGEAYLKLNNLPAARQQLHTALSTSLSLRALPVVLGTVMFFGRLMYAEGQTGRALALLGAILAHPAADGDSRYGIEMLLKEWNLDEQTAAAGLQAGASLDWDALIQELLALG